GRVRALVDGEAATTVIAVGPPERLGAAGIAGLGPPPDAMCAFAFRLPQTARGQALTIEAIGDRGRVDAVLLTTAFETPEAAARYREGSVMSDSVTMEGLRFQSGVFRARMRVHGGGSAPEVSLRVRGETVSKAVVKGGADGLFDLTAEAPLSVLGDGVSMIEFALADGSTLGRYPVAAGAALVDDLASEVASLRAELDQLKRAFRDAMAGGVISRDERPLIVAEALTEVDALLEMRDRADNASSRVAETTDWEDDAAPWDVDEG
ncbi:MAG: hypothetical protein AAF360_17630, partial [Pseudomonadota bacterium]